uniref:Uncharacterized protein n=1 Tax=Physcomitrium patens TaxID=3218 RepID=A0A2K1JXZ1_PHYPA|nr:hypothetical protein PHYPA_013498 [Physcomitrium patens]
MGVCWMMDEYLRSSICGIGHCWALDNSGSLSTWLPFFGHNLTWPRICLVLAPGTLTGSNIIKLCGWCLPGAQTSLQHKLSAVVECPDSWGQHPIWMNGAMK